MLVKAKNPFTNLVDKIMLFLVNTGRTFQENKLQLAPIKIQKNKQNNPSPFGKKYYK